MDNYILFIVRFKFSGLPSVSFTWDDNSLRHFSHIAPLFEQYAQRCTFYVSPGEEDFESKYSVKYRLLQNRGFEIASHGYHHQKMTSLTHREFSEDLNFSIDVIKRKCGNAPKTFAFPHHEYDEGSLKIARSIFLETRNTLQNSTRISLKSTSELDDILSRTDSAISEGRNIVFSGHSVRITQDKDQDLPGEGYEPLDLNFLEKLLVCLKSKENIEILDFKNSAVKEFIKSNNVKCDNEGIEIANIALKKFEIDIKDYVLF